MTPPIDELTSFESVRYVYVAYHDFEEKWSLYVEATDTKVRFTILHVSSVNDELLSAVGKLAAEYGRIGGNLNQIARYLNEYGAPYHALSGEVRAAIADLAALKYEVLKKVGDAVGNTQTYQL